MKPPFHQSQKLEYHTNTITRGNKYKLRNQSFHYDVRKYSFTSRIVNTWNSSPDYVVNVDSVEVFKNCSDLGRLKYKELQ